MGKIASSVLMAWLFFIACAPYTSLEVPKVEIEGFRGIKWGTPVDQLKSEMIFVGRDTGRDIEWYNRKDEALSMGKAKAESITYIFLRGVFNKVSMVAKGTGNYEAFKDYLLTNYGEAAESKEHTYTWSRDNTLITFAYNSSIDVILLIFQERKGEEKRTPGK